MELLEFARGPALQISITIFVFGIAFRVFSLFLMWRTRDSSAGSRREKTRCGSCDQGNYPAYVAAGRLQTADHVRFD